MKLHDPIEKCAYEHCPNTEPKTAVVVVNETAYCSDWCFTKSRGGNR